MKEIMKRTATALVLTLGILVSALSTNPSICYAEEEKINDYTVAYYRESLSSWASDYQTTYYTFKSQYPVYSYVVSTYENSGAHLKEVRYFAIDESLETGKSGAVVASLSGTFMERNKNSGEISSNSFSRTEYIKTMNKTDAIDAIKSGLYSSFVLETVTEITEIPECFEEQYKAVGLSDVVWSIPHFESANALIAFLENGDDSGQINKPEPDMTAPHDFSKDLIYQEIPLPELSRLGYNGFVVDNLGEYYMDVIMETRLYGVKHVPVEYDNKYVGNTPIMDAFEWGTTVDTTWTYKRHYYNLDDHVPISSKNISSNSTVYINEIYGVDNFSVFETDFQTWSAEFPESKNLPDYSWTKTGARLNYSLNYVYDANDNAPPRVTNNGMAETIYYVRFFDEKLKTGQWVKYSYRCGPYDVKTETIPGNVVTEVVDGGIINDNGTGVITKDTTIGVTDINGYISYPTPDTYSTEYTLTGFVQTLELFANALTRVPVFVNNMFGFLPWWSQGLLGLAVGAAVVMRFLGR